ncbi:MAG: hypothetical protein DSZ24_06655 [Thermodesulfatator sp.]|nr:MAG: hypothetical protein DSZ24_06655 [Thermodesulfatator sp.]
MRKMLLLFLVVWGLAFTGNLGAQGGEHYEKRWHQGAGSSGPRVMEGQGMQGQRIMKPGMRFCPLMMPASPKGISPQLLRKRAQMMREIARMMEEMARKMESGKVSQEEWDQFRHRMYLFRKQIHQRINGHETSNKGL